MKADAEIWTPFKWDVILILSTHRYRDSCQMRLLRWKRRWIRWRPTATTAAMTMIRHFLVPPSRFRKRIDAQHLLPSSKWSLDVRFQILLWRINRPKNRSFWRWTKEKMEDGWRDYKINLVYLLLSTTFTRTKLIVKKWKLYSNLFLLNKKILLLCRN